MLLLGIAAQRKSKTGIPLCRQCDKPLRSSATGRRGYRGRGSFCSASCAVAFAEWVLLNVDTGAALTLKGGDAHVEIYAAMRKTTT